MTCYELLQQHIDRHGKWYFYRRAVGVSRILREIEGLAAAFTDLGLKKGDVVSLYLPTCPQSIAAFYACSKLGIVASFIHPRMSVATVADIVAKTGSKAVFFFDALNTSDEPFADMAPIAVRCSVADYEGVLAPLFKWYSRCKCERKKGVYAYSALAEKRKSTQIVGTDENVVCYMHSGGTSGEPKVVALSNRAMNYVAETIGKLHRQEHACGKYALVTLPVFHAYGLCASVHAPLLLGYSLALVPKFGAKPVRRYLRRLNVGLWLVVPGMLRKLISQNKFACKGLAHIRDLWCGGDYIEQSLVDEVNNILRDCGSSATLLRGYGLTETCGAVVVSSGKNNRKLSCGKPIDGTRVEVVDDLGHVQPANTVGELVIYSPALMTGYLDGGEAWTGDGGVKTGDVGYIDDDGYVYVIDRKKRSVKIASINVFPAEVERCICTLPYVSQCCVVGYKQQNKQFLKAFVTLDKKVPVDENKLVDEVKKVCLTQLSPYAVPERVEVIDKMPMTPIGKVDYRALQ